jgi:glutamine synthetase
MFLVGEQVMPGQWEYQVGPCVGIDSGDQMHMTRFLLHRVCEEHGISLPLFTATLSFSRSYFFASP